MSVAVFRMARTSIVVVVEKSTEIYAGLRWLSDNGDELMGTTEFTKGCKGAATKNVSRVAEPRILPRVGCEPLQRPLRMDLGAAATAGSR